MSDPQTIREHQQEIIALIERFESGGRLDLQAVTDHAVAALDLLDKGKRRNEYGTRLGSGEFVCVLDPAPRGDAA